MRPSIRQAAELLTLGSPTVRELHPATLESALVESLTGLAFLFGHSNTLADGESLETMAMAVSEVVKRHFPAFTLAEISLALRRGASGEWQQPNTLLLPNLPNIMHWLTCYQAQVRAVALKALQQAATPPPALPTYDPATEYPERVTSWAATLAAGKPLQWAVLDPGNVVYDWLKRIGAFRPYLTTRRYHRMQRTVCWLICTHPPASIDEARHRRAFRDAARMGQFTGKKADLLMNACRKFLLREWLHYQAQRPASVLLPWLEELAASAAS